MPNKQHKLSVEVTLTAAQLEYIAKRECALQSTTCRTLGERKRHASAFIARAVQYAAQSTVERAGS